MLICDRCLDDLHFPIEAEYHIVVKYGEDYNDDNDEVLEIPESDANLNASLHDMYDTVVLAIPIKHVHPLGKVQSPDECNAQETPRSGRAMRIASLKTVLVDEIDSIDAGAPCDAPSDPRWDALRKFSPTPATLNKKYNYKKQWHILNANNPRPAPPSVVLTTWL